MQQHPDAWVSHRRGLWTFARELAESTLKADRSVAALLNLVKKLARLVDRDTEAFAKRANEAMGPDRPKLACKAGCWFCCTQPVGASVPEILRVAAEVRQKWSPEEQAALRERISRYRQAAENRARTGKPRRLVHVCPLLKDGLCSVWDVRPLACRGANSYDVEVCKRILNDADLEYRIPTDLVQLGIADCVKGGLYEGLESSGLGGHSDLTLGLEVALAEPDAAERYIAGEPVFAPVVAETQALHPDSEGDAADLKSPPA